MVVSWRVSSHAVQINEQTTSSYSGCVWMVLQMYKDC